jgi:hypothetical protein
MNIPIIEKHKYTIADIAENVVAYDLLIKENDIKELNRKMVFLLNNKQMEFNITPHDET